MPDEPQTYSTAKIADAAQYINDLALHTSAASTLVTAAFAAVSYKMGLTSPLLVFGSSTLVQVGLTAFNAWHYCHYRRRRRPETHARANYRCREAFARKLAGPVLAISTFSASAFCDTTIRPPEPAPARAQPVQIVTTTTQPG